MRYAKAREMISLGENGSETERKAGKTPVFVTNEYQRNPAEWHTSMPIMPKMIFFQLFAGTEQSAAIGIKPMRNPPVDEASTESPARNPENTGTPAAPSARYVSTAATEYGAGRRSPHKATANVCNVTGTPVGMGMDINVHTAISAAKSAAKVNFSIDFFLFIKITPAE